MEGPFRFCLGPLEIQMVGAQDPQQKMSTESPAYLPHKMGSSVLQAMACRQLDANPFTWTNAVLWSLGWLEITFGEISHSFYSRKCTRKWLLKNDVHFVEASMCWTVTQHQYFYKHHNSCAITSTQFNSLRPSDAFDDINLGQHWLR